MSNLSAVAPVAQYGLQGWQGGLLCSTRQAQRRRMLLSARAGCLHVIRKLTMLVGCLRMAVMCCRTVLSCAFTSSPERWPESKHVSGQTMKTVSTAAAPHAMAAPQAGPNDPPAKKPTAADRALARKLRDYSSGEVLLCRMTHVTDGIPHNLSQPRPVRCKRTYPTFSGRLPR